MGKRHPIWQYFIAGTKQNGSHLQAHCIGCVEAQRPEGLAIDLTNDDPEKLKLSSESWVIEGVNKALVYNTDYTTRACVTCEVISEDEANPVLSYTLATPVTFLSVPHAPVFEHAYISTRLSKIRRCHPRSLRFGPLVLF
ncbi:hypothetical protein CPB84DRAFT_1850125 [Gymnopilus junonius]|uniref:Uncharacterized protein n=1 Tax=Gymnopilus junonius TaxID=109634 RepID=A0A9P5NI75_GYMJU|nr:hypothetical protein CPB84DRAFT_1850125 [Gymnopilus junonius]